MNKKIHNFGENFSFSIKNKVFVLFLFVIITSVSIVGFFGFIKATQSYTKASIASNYQKTHDLANDLEGILRTIPNDVFYTSNFYALEKLLVWEGLGEKRKIKYWKNIYTSALKDYMNSENSYYKIRVFSVNGDEQISIKRNEKTGKAMQVDINNFSNKANRDYFSEALKLEKGEVYISKMNLNIEHGKIEKSYIPVIRYSTPIINKNGELKGVIVLNFDANYILDEIIKRKSLDDKNNVQEYYLLNEEGYYLFHKDRTKMWGFQLGLNTNFNNDYKGVFDKLKEDKLKIYIENNKIYSMDKVYPNKKDNKYQYWYLVTVIDKDVALSLLEEFIYQFLFVLLGVLLVSFILINKYISRLMDPLSIVNVQLQALSKGEIQKEEISYLGNDEVGQIVKSTNILIDAIETTIIQANAIASGDFTKDIILLGKNDALGMALHGMTQRLKEIANLSNNLAVGNYDVRVIAKSDKDELGLALLSTIEYLENITKITESIALGDIDVRYIVRSKEDRLGFAILEMLEYLKSIVNQANNISKNDFSQSIEAKSKKDNLGLSIATMTELLRQNSIKNKNEIWFNEGLRLFSDKIIGITNPLVLSNISLNESCRYLNIMSSIMYSFDKESDSLVLTSSFSFVKGKNTIEEFALGEGVIGQVGLERKLIVLKNLEENNLFMDTGIENLQVKEIIVFPLVHDKKLLGVVQMQSAVPFTAIQKEYLMEVSQIFSTTFFTLVQNLQIKKLLKESQKAFEELQLKSEEMQTQSEELRASNEQMEEQATQLQTQSANLQEKNKEIEQAKKEIDIRANELETSNQYKSEFLANMSHELRTPLNSVILLSSLLSKNTQENLLDKDIEKIAVINESGNELLRLINDILDLSKIESGKMELIVDKIDSYSLLNNYNEVFSHSAKDKGISLIIRDNYQNTFYNDKDRLNQVVRNLISNSLKFTKKGLIEVSISQSVNYQLPIQISIKDTGIGIAKEKQELIFKAFMQADGSTSREFGGTGLGLSISKELVHLMGGKIVIDSIVGEGSTFSIYLPNLKDKYKDKKIQDVSKKNYTDKTVINRIEKPEVLIDKFLIIEDNQSFANVLKNIVEEKGLKAFVAHTGKEGISIAQKHHINGAIIDLGLPDIPGIEVIKELKSNPLTQDIHIQVISGQDIGKENFENIRIDGYLQKPVSAAQIHQTIEKIESQKDVQTKSILIIEDNLVHLNALHEYLDEEREYDITTAQTLVDAKKIIEEKYFDIAIVDLALSDGSGIEICQKISQSKEDTVVLIYTGRDLTMDEADYLNEISDEIIIKNPNSHLRLNDEITRFLETPSVTVNKKFSSQITNLNKDFSSKEKLENKKVLIVDDDIKNIFVLSAALQEHNMNISHARNGKEALEFLGKNKDMDIIMMDIMMPIMDGYECMKAIRLDDTLKHLPIIAVTAKAMAKDKEKALQSGADDYLTKPIDLEKLRTMIMMWINK